MIKTKTMLAVIGGLLFFPNFLFASRGMNRPHQVFFDAIRQVETGGEPNGGRDTVGDNGKALGPYQIHKEYWQDAIEYDPSLGNNYERVKDRAYAEQVMMAYWSRYAPKGATLQDLARIHNGGPNGHRNTSTLSYWAKVKAAMGESKEKR